MAGDLTDAVALLRPSWTIALPDVGDPDELELSYVQRVPAVGEAADTLGQIWAASAFGFCVHPCHAAVSCRPHWGNPAKYGWRKA